GSLTATLALYNRHAAAGADPLFHKHPRYVVPLSTPPFGAFDCTAENSIYAAFTLGGLHTDTEGRVLDADGDAIPGLFAAGRATSGLSVGGYSSGLSLGDGTFFGRRAGRCAASASRGCRAGGGSCCSRCSSRPCRSSPGGGAQPASAASPPPRSPSHCSRSPTASRCSRRNCASGIRRHSRWCAYSRGCP